MRAEGVIGWNGASCLGGFGQGRVVAGLDDGVCYSLEVEGRMRKTVGRKHKQVRDRVCVVCHG